MHAVFSIYVAFCLIGTLPGHGKQHTCNAVEQHLPNGASLSQCLAALPNQEREISDTIAARAKSFFEDIPDVHVDVTTAACAVAGAMDHEGPGA
jgi:hypothetical protein